MNMSIFNRAGRIAAITAMACVLAACSSNSASTSNFRSAVRKYVDANPQAFDLALPLNHTRADSNGLVLGNDRPTLDYAVLQVMTDNGLLKRRNGADRTIHYHVNDNAGKYLHRDDGQTLSVSVAKLAPVQVSSFTQPINNDGVKVAHATVVFKNRYAEWLSEDDAKKIRDWTAVISQQNNASNPALKPFGTSLVTTALSGLMVSAFGGNASDLDQATTYWTALAAKSYTYDVPLELTNDGWAASRQSDDWKLQDVDGVGNLEPRAIAQMTPATLAAINHKITKADPPGQDAVRKAISESKKLGAMTVQMPLDGAGNRVCTAEYRKRTFGAATLHYNCDKNMITRLDTLIEKGLIERSIPKAGEVRYRIRPELKAYLARSGTLRTGEYRVGAIDGGDVEIAPSGYSMYTATVSVAPQPYDWARAIGGNRSAQQLKVQMAHAETGWFAVNVSQPR